MMPDEAVICTEPPARPVARPVLLTTAFVVSDERHVSGTPDIALPRASDTVALNWRVNPTSTESTPPVTLTRVATWRTSTEALPRMLPTAATIAEAPLLAAVNVPFALIEPTVAFAADHVIVTF